jgi:hypothetical protein
MSITVLESFSTHGEFLNAVPRILKFFFIVLKKDPYSFSSHCLLYLYILYMYISYISLLYINMPIIL